MQKKEIVCNMKSGFTLIELCITLGLIALVYGLSIVSINIQRYALIQSEINTLKSVCLAAQQLAYATHTQQIIYFDSTKNQYVYNNHVHHLANPVVFGYCKNVQGPPSHPVHPINTAITFTNECITFSPHGIIQSGTIYFNIIGDSRMYALTSGIAHTSFLRTYVYDGSWKVIG